MALTPELLANVCGSRAQHMTQCVRIADHALTAMRDELAALGHIHDASTVERRLGDHFADARARISGIHVICRRSLELLSSEPAISATALSQRLGSGASDVSRRFHRDLGVAS
jgi:hypothetical protein